MSDLNENHKRHLSSTFKSLDEMLSEIVRFVDGSEAGSTFSSLVPNATPVQQRVIRDYAGKLRATMQQIIERLGIDLPPRHISTTWAARTTLASADIAIEELKPKYLRGYGELSGAAITELEQVIAQLREPLGRMESYLARAQAVDLGARLAKLDPGRQDFPLLRELERIITIHGFIEFRGELEMLIERLENSAYEVAIFGRVSSGKSSLLDHILETNLLPVGVTPVTSIPTRIRYGEVQQASISFAEAQPASVDPARLAEFVTEQQNPGNVKHVTRIKLRLNAPSLKSGVVFVDTPGVGSLATSGAAQTQAYLPRCDLGVVLIDSASTLTPEDLTLVDAIHRSGAEVMVLLSKADMLSASDRPRAAEYCTQQIQRNVGIDVPVFPASVIGKDAALSDQWFAEALEPRMENSRQLASESVNRKIQTLRQLVLDRLRKRLNRSPDSEPDIARRQAADSLSAIAAEIERLRNEPPDELADVTVQVDHLLDTAATRIAAAWTDDSGASAADPMLVQHAAKEQAESLAASVAADVRQLTSRAAGALKAAAVSGNGDLAFQPDLPRSADLPQWECWLPDSLSLHRPILAGLSAGIAQRAARSQLHAVRDELFEALRLYTKVLQEWRRSALAELRRNFIAKAELIQGALNGPSQARDEPEAQTQREQIDADITVLEIRQC